MLNRMSLDGTWHLRWNDGQRGGSLLNANRSTIDESDYIEAQVPGEIHLDLWREGIIEDPYIGVNCLAARWVEETLWCYRKTFTADRAMVDTKAWLNFDGLDLIASIFLNGELVGAHENAFYPCRIDVSGKLREGENILTIQIESGLFSVSDKPYEGLQATSVDSRLHKRHWLRKPQCQFGWDWATRLINVGIFKSVTLEWTTLPIRVDQLVPLVELSDDLQQGNVRTRLFIEGVGTTPIDGELTVEIVETEQKRTASITIKPGIHPYEMSLLVEQPELWWPVNHGAQPLYTVRAAVSVSGTLVGEKTARVGFRHVHINQDVHPDGGRYFIIEINHKPIFCKGANLVPADMIFARLDQARYSQLVDLALEANFNFLRVWGGGLYESNEFYELCDKKGILVWQEFIFACAKYPAYDVNFHNNVKTEAIYNIRRLAQHPSLVVWCGNNEMEWGIWDWDFGKVGRLYPDYGLFHLTLPQLMAQEDPTRYYQPSSPFSPDHLPPNQDNVGDQHPWGVKGDYRGYRSMICRFPNEGGTLGPVALPTVLACLPEGQRTTTSFAWKVHDNGGAFGEGVNSPNQILIDWLGTSLKALSVEDFVYWGGLIQGEALREYCDNFRRRMFSCSGAIFWMYNDCWPATRSWTIIDYYLRRTPAFAAVQRTFAPVHVVVAQDDDMVSVYGINEQTNTITADLHYGIFDLTGGFSLDCQTMVEIPSNSSTLIASFPITQWQKPETSAAFAILEQNHKVIARNRLFLPVFKEIEWPIADIQVQVEGEVATFTSNTFAWGVCLDLVGERPLTDNFFDIYPGIPYQIYWPYPESPTVLKVGNLKS